MSNKNYYSDDTALTKKERLSSLFESIKGHLDNISAITVSDSWECDDSKTINSTLIALNDKIPQIKSVIKTYEDFLSGTNSTYTEVSEDVNTALASYEKEE